MDQEFESLINLQEIDRKLTSLKRELDNLPTKFQEIEEKRKKSLSDLNKAKDKLQANQKKRRELELEVQGLKEKLAKLKKQQNEVKTNKEYSAIRKEIEYMEGEIEKKEEDILEELLAADDLKLEIEEAEKKNKIQEKKLKEEERMIFNKKENMEKQIENLKLEKNKLLPKVPKKYLDLYKKIYSKKNGIVLSPVSDEFCSVCNMRIRPQVLNELKSNKELIFCENCGRILYLIQKPSKKKNQE